jgi:hypothetical protein
LPLWALRQSPHNTRWVVNPSTISLTVGTDIDIRAMGCGSMPQLRGCMRCAFANAIGVWDEGTFSGWPFAVAFCARVLYSGVCVLCCQRVYHQHTCLVHPMCSAVCVFAYDWAVLGRCGAFSRAAATTYDCVARCYTNRGQAAMRLQVPGALRLVFKGMQQA